MAAVRFEPKRMDCPLKTKEAIEKAQPLDTRPIS